MWNNLLVKMVYERTDAHRLSLPRPYRNLATNQEAEKHKPASF